MLSSHGALELTVDGRLLNQRGTVIADGDMQLSVDDLDNSHGQIAGKTNVTASVASLNNQTGQLVATGTLRLTGIRLDNRQGGLLGASDALHMQVDAVDNRGGELSSKAGVTLIGNSLDNSDGGQVFAEGVLALTVDQVLNRAKGLLSGKSGLTLTGSGLNNSGGSLRTQQNLKVDLQGDLDNSQGLLSAEGTLGIKVRDLTNTAGSVSSAGALTVASTGVLTNQGGEIVTDAELRLKSASLDNRNQGSLSGKGAVVVDTGAFDNSHGGRLSSGASLDLTAAQLTNQDTGRIASAGKLSASVSGLEQQGGQLFSNTALDLDLNHGQLNNQNGLINAPLLMLRNLKGVGNQGGEISSAQAFSLAAERLDNSNGKLLSNQGLTLRIDQALSNLKGLIAAAALDAKAASLDNGGGTLTSRTNLELKLDGLLNNQNQGLINASTGLTLSSGGLNNQNGSLLGSAIAIDFGAATGDLNNSGGLITTAGSLSIDHLRDLNNQNGELSSSQNLDLNARELNNSAGKLISNQRLTVSANTVLNQAGLISGWQGLNVTAASLDNRNQGTLSSRNGDVEGSVTGAILNSGAGALVSQKALSVSAASLDNSNGGILSSGAAQTLTVGGLLNNALGGLIDSGATLTMQAMTLGNAAGTVNGQQALSFTGTTLDNGGGNLVGNGAVTLDLLGALINTNGKLASAGPLRLQRSTRIDNQGGQLASQGLMSLLTGGLDNRNRGTVAANDQLTLTTPGAIQNGGDGLIYSQNGGLQVQAGSLANGKGTLQSQGALNLSVGGDIDNQSGRILAKAGDLSITAGNLDNRGGVLSSLQGAFTAQLTGVLKNGYDLNNNRQGGIAQAQRLNLSALGGIDNYGGRIAAQTGDATISTRDFDNRNGGLYAKGRVKVSGNHFDNSGDNDGQIAGNWIDLDLTGALNNRLGIIESDSTLAIKAASLDNQTGKLRALGTSGQTNLQIGGLFDNRNGTLESANSDLSLGVGSFLNGGGSLLHVGTGTFDISTANVTGAGGSIVTRGGLTLNADNWSNSNVIQAGRLNVNVNSFSQTASGQLLASDSFVGTGGNWYNDGLIASDGSLSLSLGTYNGNGRVSSLGTLDLTASQLSLNSAGSIAGGGNTLVNVAGQLSNYGRITSATTLTTNANTLKNYGTLGSGQNLTVNAPSLLNDHGLIFSGADMALRVTDFNNLYADVYSLGGIDIAADGAGGRARLVSNRSSTMESVGDFSLSATTFENTKDRFTYSSKKISGALGAICLHDCWNEDNKIFQGSGAYVLTENFEAIAGEDSASSLMTAGGNIRITGSKVSNLYSTISAVGNISITADDFQNQAAQVGSYSVKSTYESRGNMPGFVTDGFFEYNQRNNPDFPSIEYQQYEPAWGITPAKTTTWKLVPYVRNVPRSDSGTGGFVEVYWFTDGYEINTERSAAYQPYFLYSPTGIEDYYSYNGPASLYNPNNLVAAPTWLDSLPLMNREVTGALGNAPAVIQAGGQVSINASSSLNNSVITPFSTVSQGRNQASNTAVSSASQAVFIPASLLPPELRQSQVNPLGLPGFSLPSGQNGLFRLSGQDSSTPVASGPQSWTMGGASLGTAQRQQALPVGQAREIQVGNVAQVSASSVELISTTRQAANLGTSASTINTTVANSDPVSGATLPGRSTTNDTTSQATQVVDQSTQPAAITVNRVQGLSDSSVQSRPHKYLIETNPVLTDLKQFMSSDYLLSNLGYNPDESAKRLGDGLYEQRLIQQAVLARTGQRYIDGQTSDEAMFKYLMNNAIASKEQLNLSMGVTLTAQQVAALTHDIVWLEEHEVNGEKVLVPVLYLANANQRLAANGALIQGTDISLIAGKDLNNSGTLRASENLAAIAGTDLVNSGLIEAGNRLDLLAGNNLVNKAGGIISGRDVGLTALNGDVINERSVNTYDAQAGVWNQHREFLDSAARIEAANDLTIKAGRDVSNIGSTLQAGRDMSISAGRDVAITSAVEHNTEANGTNNTKEQITQYESRLTAGRDMTVGAGRNLAIVASQLEAKRDIAMAAIENVTVGSAADEEHSYFKSKKVTAQEDHIQQVGSSISAGNDVAISAGKDIALISSRITSGDEAYLVAGGELDLLAAQDSDYSLYSRKNKTGFGKRTRRDEITQVNHVGSEISAGGDLTLISEGDQRYQAAKLDSGQDLTLKSGGAITFEGVKDLHQESHEKSSNSLAWTSAKGKGSTDETLRQTEIVAQGKLAIQAVDGLNIDIKQIDQKSVSQTIDAMVQADPQLAWLKEAEQRGDVDWRKVQEVHDSFKYSHSGLGGGAALVIAIIVTYFTWGAGAGLVGAASTTTTGIAANSVVSAVAVKGATSTVNNKGNLGDVVKDVTSDESLKGYAIAGISGVASQLAGVSGSFTASNLGRQIAVSSALKTATNGGSFIKNVGQAAIDLTASLVSGAIYERVGTHLSGTGLSTKVAVHAIVGGLIAEAAGGDFASGAIAAGANKALIQTFGAEMFPGEAHDRVLAMTSQLIGMTVAAGVGGSSKDQEVAGWVAQQGTVYNYLEHSDVKAFAKDMRDCGTNTSCQESRWKNEKYNEESLYNTQYAMQISSPLLAKDKLPGIIAGLDELMAMPCQTEVCENYKAELVGRSVAAAEHLAKQIADWGPSMDRLALLGGGGAANSRWEAKPKLPGATEPAGLAQLEKAIKYLQGAKGILTPKDFPEISTKISQKQLRHIAGTQQLEARGGGGFLSSVSDAQKVLDAYHAGQVRVLGKNAQGFPVVKFEGVTGTNVNLGVGITEQATNVFIIKGTKSPSIVPTNPNWSQK